MKTLTSIILFLFSLQAITMAQSLQRVAPEQVGMDSRKLMYADEAIEEAIANKEIPGAVLAVVRNGKMAYLKAYGNKRIYPNTEPMTANTNLRHGVLQQIHVYCHMYHDFSRSGRYAFLIPSADIYRLQRLGK